MAIEKDIEELAKQRDGILDLRYNNGQWCVRVSIGNIMAVVPGTIKPTAQGSLTAALERWHYRSFTHPFISFEKGGDDND